MQYLVPCFVLDDDKQDIETMKEQFDKEHELDCHFFTNPSEFINVFNEDVWVAVIDFNLPGMDGQRILDHVLKINPECHAILISGLITPSLAVRLNFAGAKDCIEKKGDWEELLVYSIKKNLDIVQSKISKKETDRRERREITKLLGK